MLEIKKNNFTKKNISRKISERTGLSNLYSNKITDDQIDIIKKNLKSKEVNIKNFGTFKILNKQERVGRNPKNMKAYVISKRKSISFIVSNKFNKKINNY